MLLSALGLLVGLALLTFAADHFVIGAVRVAARLRLSTVLIGALVIGFGTSAPEMVVSGLAAGQGELAIAVGNIIGSNSANLTLVLGAAALVTPVLVKSPTLRREAPFSLAAVVLFAVLVRDGLSVLDASMLTATLAVTLVYVVVSSRSGDAVMSEEVEEYLADVPERMWPPVLRTLLGLLGTLVAAQILVVSARDIAAELGLAEGFVGVTIVAVGTSLPELATALQAARKDETDLIVGNLLGSNVFNSLAVGGIAGLAGPGPVGDPSLTGIGLVMMVGIAVVATFMMVTRRRVERWEGLLLLALWAIMIPLLF